MAVRINKKKCDEIIKFLRTKVDENGVLELTCDIETSHNEVKNYRMGKQYVRHGQIRRERNIIMIQMGHVDARRQKDIFTLEWDWELWENRDERLLREFVYILEAFEDVIIYSKNGERFDIPYINGRLFLLQLPPMRIFEHKDIERLIRKNMYLNSFALDYLAKLLMGSGKVKMDEDVWFAIEEEGSEKDMNRMRRYGKKDVTDTNGIIKKATPYIPEMRAYCNIKFTGEHCHHCKANRMLGKLEKRGFRRTPSGKRQIWHCTNPRHPVTKPKWFIENRVQRYD